MGKVVALYTETLQELLEHLNYGEASQDASLTEVLGLMAKFPNFTFDNNLTLNMTTLFMEKYDIREIGSESEELFMHFWREKTNELLLKYYPKIKGWLENFNDLFKFTVKLTASETYSNGTQNNYYLNPITATTGVGKTVVVNPTTGETTTTFSGGNLKVQDVDTSDNAGTRKSERDVLQSVWGKTRADILAKIMALKDIYNDCLNEYQTIFMGVL